jgi:hypothetical protein
MWRRARWRPERGLQGKRGPECFETGASLEASGDPLRDSEDVWGSRWWSVSGGCGFLEPCLTPCHFGDRAALVLEGYLLSTR